MAYLFNDDKSKIKIATTKITNVSATSIPANGLDTIIFNFPSNSGSHMFIGIPEMYIEAMDGKKVEITGYKTYHQKLSNYDQIMVYVKNNNDTSAIFPAGADNRSYVTVAYLE